MASPHQVLGVDPDADRETVERRYRELVKEVHPDAGGSVEEFKRVKRAYRAIVSDGGAGPTGPGSSRGSRRSGSGSSQSGTGGGGAGSSGTQSGTSGSRGGSADDRGNSSSSRGGSDRSRRSGATEGADGGSRRQYTAAGRERRASSAAGTGAAGAGAAGTGTSRSTGGGAGATGNRSGTSTDRETGGSGGATGVPRRWFLYGFSAIFAGAAYALRDQTLPDILNDGDGGGEPPDRSAASGLPIEDSDSREISPEEIFDVEFETPTAATVEFTVEGADTRDWINVYTREEYERVAESWDGEGRFDPGEPLETVLTDEGYVADLPEAGTYVILVKLWAGPPDDPREARTVEISYEVSA